MVKYKFYALYVECLRIPILHFFLTAADLNVGDGLTQLCCVILKVTAITFGLAENLMGQLV